MRWKDLPDFQVIKGNLEDGRCGTRDASELVAGKQQWITLYAPWTSQNRTMDHQQSIQTQFCLLITGGEGTIFQWSIGRLTVSSVKGKTSLLSGVDQATPQHPHSATCKHFSLKKSCYQKMSKTGYRWKYALPQTIQVGNFQSNIVSIMLDMWSYCTGNKVNIYNAGCLTLGNTECINVSFLMPTTIN